MQSHVMVGTGIFRALSRELECEVARNNVTASRSELHLTTVSHLGRGVFFFLRLKKTTTLSVIDNFRFSLRRNRSIRMTSSWIIIGQFTIG